ncbi:peptidylprolyl isomerase [Leifsonia sp. NPDC056824]|uniref:peptidylprolyl isomerase n=1 Tax=Leifsonia sp. NPDC056824 TaxID=3345953 RepID=UPI00368DA549
MRRATALGRSSVALLALGIAAAALTGCSSDPNTDCGSALKSGQASDLVTASGKIGQKPKVTVPTPVDAATSERTVLTQGSGTMVHTGQLVELGYTQLDGQSGQVAGTGYGSSSVVLPMNTSGSGVTGAIARGLQCTTVGSRVSVAVSPKDNGSDASGSGTTQIFVFDVINTSLSAANGAVRPSVSGFPTVVLAPTGQPGVTIPSSGGAPTTVRSEVLKAGDGATVKKDSIVTLQYTAVGWDSKSVTTKSWSNGGPGLVNMSTGQLQIQNNDNVSALPQSMLGKLVGQKVGSQLVIETPKDNNFDAQAWVVDILGVR